jgi:hypothetical protein
MDREVRCESADRRRRFGATVPVLRRHWRRLRSAAQEAKLASNCSRAIRPAAVPGMSWLGRVPRHRGLSLGLMRMPRSSKLGTALGRRTAALASTERRGRAPAAACARLAPATRARRSSGTDHLLVETTTLSKMLRAASGTFRFGPGWL